MTALIRLSKPCNECGGTDEVGVDGRKSSALNPAQGPCPSCVSGWLPDDKTVEAAAGVLHEKGFREVTRKMLVAAARYQSEEKP